MTEDLTKGHSIIRYADTLHLTVKLSVFRQIETAICILNPDWNSLLARSYECHFRKIGWILKTIQNAPNALTHTKREKMVTAPASALAATRFVCRANQPCRKSYFSHCLGILTSVGRKVYLQISETKLSPSAEPWLNSGDFIPGNFNSHSDSSCLKI